MNRFRKFAHPVINFRNLLKGEKMNKSIQVVAIMLSFALFIGACQPVPVSAQQGQGTPTLDTQSQVNTAVAQTIEAQNQVGTAVALTTEAQFTATPTATLVTIPTLTPFVVSTPTYVSSSGGGAATAQPKYSCDIIHLRPTAYAEYNRGAEFDIKMTVVNNGTRDWYQGFDLKYSGGVQMTSVTRVQLPAMAVDDQYEVVLDAVAPKEKGTQVMTWRVDGPSCFGYVVIVVK
jgi:hypothetical protein